MYLFLGPSEFRIFTIVHEQDFLSGDRPTRGMALTHIERNL